eukprot:6526849-Prymnesium_polylepis.1
MLWNVRRCHVAKVGSAHTHLSCASRRLRRPTHTPRFEQSRRTAPTHPMHGETVRHPADPLTNGSTNVRIRDGRLLSERRCPLAQPLSG